MPKTEQRNQKGLSLLPDPTLPPPPVSSYNCRKPRAKRLLLNIKDKLGGEGNPSGQRDMCLGTLGLQTALK